MMMVQNNLDEPQLDVYNARCPNQKGFLPPLKDQALVSDWGMSSSCCDTVPHTW